MKASVIIPSWNTAALTLRTLDSVLRYSGLDPQVIVVDNGSTDGTMRFLGQYETVIKVSKPENVGYAAGCNAGAGVATGEHLIYLNSDVVVTQDWDRLLVEACAERVAATGPVSNRVSGVQCDVRARYESLVYMHAYAAGRAESLRGQTLAVRRLVGFCLCVPRWAWETVGPFDTRYAPGNFDDDDWCRRAVEAGLELRVVLGCFIHHEGQATFKANGLDYDDAMRVNAERYRAKWGAGEPLA